jgi:hypothetical protein
MCDVGMTGPYASVLGREVAPVIARFMDGMPRRFEVATGDVRMSAALIEIDPSMARASRIELLTVRRYAGRSGADDPGLLVGADVPVALVARLEELLHVQRAKVVQVLVEGVLEGGRGLGRVVVRPAQRLRDHLVDGPELLQVVRVDLEGRGGLRARPRRPSRGSRRSPPA